MSRFDLVKFERLCPGCGIKIDFWQTKDGLCEFETVQFWDVDYFYSLCSKCGVFIEYRLRAEVRKKFKLGDYEIKITKTKEENKEG